EYVGPARTPPPTPERTFHVRRGGETSCAESRPGRESAGAAASSGTRSPAPQIRLPDLPASRSLHLPCSAVPTVQASLSPAPPCSSWLLEAYEATLSCSAVFPSNCRLKPHPPFV